MSASLSLRTGIALSLSVLVGLPLGAATAGAAGGSLSPQRATIATDLCATAGTMSLPGAPSVAVWGYTDCSSSSITKPGGPTLVFAQDDTVTITLHNNLLVATGLVFPGIPQPPDTVGVAAGGTKTYSFTASKPGTFLYEAALLPNAQYQVAMGLYGALTVTPPTPGTAYADALPTQHSAFDTSATVVLSEIDPALNNASNPALFDLRKFAPKYGLINGAVHPNTVNIAAAASSKVLLRYVNAGLKLHSMAALGVHQTVIANDGNELRYPHKIVAETFGPGQTADVIATLPSTAPAKYAIYDGGLTLHNNGSGAGGMLTFISVVGSTTPATTPTTSGVTVTPATSSGAAPVAVTADVASTTAVTAAEFFIDTVGANGSGTAMTGSTAINGTIAVATLAGLTGGTHVVYVHAQNASGWGPLSSTALNLDTSGPVTSGLVLNPSVTNNTAVTLTATGNDTTTGGAVVTAASYTIDGGASVAMSTQSSQPPTTPVTAFTASIPTAGLTAGTHSVAVQTTDALGNQGVAVTITLTIDRAGPVATPGSTTASKNPTNGVIGVSSGVPAVRITSTFTDLLSNIAGAEGFIQTAGTSGTGFVFAPSDGVWGGQVSGTITDVVFADIPLATIAALSDGPHPIFVHAKDAAGNWGALVSVSLVVDKTAPTFTGVSVSPNPVIVGTPIVVTVAGAADAGTGVTGGEYWLDGTATSVAPGAGTPFTVLTPSIPTGSLTIGGHSVFVRVRDAAGNWSTGTNGVRSATFTVVTDAIFANGFETAALPGAWSSRSTTTLARLNTTTTAPAPLVGTRSLQAQGNNTNYVQYNFGTATIPASGTYDAAFSVNLNGNNSAGKDIFAAATNTAFGTQLFHVRYRLVGVQQQVQLQVGAAPNAGWINVAAGTNRIEVVWQSGSTLTLYVNGTLVQTLTAGSGSVGSVRLGSVTATGNATLMFFDGFSSKRTVTPLIGP